MPAFSSVHFEVGVPASLHLGLPSLALFPTSRVDSFMDLKLACLEFGDD